MNNHLETTIKEFCNHLAFQLNPSNDTMEAIRLFRNELPNFLITSHINYLKGEIEEINNLVISLGSLCETETNILRDVITHLQSQLSQAEQLLGNK